MRGIYGGSHYDPKDEVLRDRLERYIALSSNLMALVSFGSIFYFKFDIRNTLGVDAPSVFELRELLSRVWSAEFAEKLAAFLYDRGLAVALFLFTALWYYRYAGAVRRELGIMSTLFAALNPPREYKALAGGPYVPLLALGLTAVFIIMTLLCDAFEFFCGAVLFLNLLDFNGNVMVRRNLKKFLADKALAPSPEDREYRFVTARRAVAEEYWIERWQLQRILIMAFVTVLGLNLYLAGDRVDDAMLRSALQIGGHVVVCGAIVWNELLMQRWRDHRDARLRQINREQAEVLYRRRDEARGEAGEHDRQTGE